MWRKGFVRTLAATLIYAGVHSLFASRWAKDKAAGRFGNRTRNALYRPFYLVQSAITIVPLIVYIKRQPKLEFYSASGPMRLTLRAAQAGALVWACWAAYEVGLTEILGIRPFVQWWNHVPAIRPEPEAQGPSSECGGLRIQGPFQWTRHPLNLAPLPVMWLNPTMTTNLLAFNLLATVYLLFGSRLEERRLFEAYGMSYRRYQDSGTPFYWPGPGGQNWLQTSQHASAQDSPQA